MFFDFREGDRNLDEIDTLICCLLHTLYRRLSPKPWHMPWPGNRASDFLVHGMMLNQPSHTGQANLSQRIY